VKTVAPETEREVMPMGNPSKSDGEEGALFDRF